LESAQFASCHPEQSKGSHTDSLILNGLRILFAASARSLVVLGMTGAQKELPR
jgi:hypothetical protein